MERKKLKSINSESGITLVALVITIIVLLILAGVTINLTLGDNGIFKMAERSATSHKESQIRERFYLILADLELDRTLGKESSTLREKILKDGLLTEQDFEGKTGLIKLLDDIIIVYDAEGFRTISEDVLNGIDYAGKNIYLANDIDFETEFNETTGTLTAGEKFTPIGGNYVTTDEDGNRTANIKEFQGKIYGLDYTIKNLYIYEDNADIYGIALVGYLGANGEINDLTIEDSYIYGASRTGSFVGKNYGIIKNCTNNSTIVGGILTGGIAARSYNLIENCTNNGKIVVSGNQTGGIVGNCDFSANNIVRNCKNTGEIISEGGSVGGIVGAIYKNQEDAKTIVENCCNEGNISGKSAAIGGIAGTASSVDIFNNINTGRIVSTAINVGGIVGHGSVEINVKQCINKAMVTGGTSTVGGIAGRLVETSSIERCYNAGAITGVLYEIGGIVGWNTGTIKQSYNIGDVGNEEIAANQIGGIVGRNLESGSVEDSYNIGKVIGDRQIGGIAGRNTNTIKRCYNIGEIKITASGAASIGAIAGYNQTTTIEESIQNCYYKSSDGLNGIYGQADITNSIEAKTINELQTKETFVNWDFEKVWKIENGKMPTLIGI